MTAPHTYDVGDRVKLEVEFRDDAGQHVDPSTVVLGIRLPDGTRQTVDYSNPGTGPLEHEGTGRFAYILTAQIVGKHAFRWLSTGPGAGAFEDYFWVRLSRPSLTEQ